MTESIRATVAILTYNGEIYLREILDAVLAQADVGGAVEVLVIDSGSTDGTLDIVRSFPGVRLHEIPNVEFGHGRTRNVAAQLARGEFVAFLTHDAIPQTPHWLKELLAPFALTSDVQGVVGRQVPRPNCVPALRYDIIHTFDSLGPRLGTTLYRYDAAEAEPGDLDVMAFYSDVNSAARRSFLVDAIPYRDVPYAEDQLFGKDLLLAGHVKAYSARAAVIHSNDLTLHEFGRRIVDETVGLRRIGLAVQEVSVAGAGARMLKGTLGDTLRLVRESDYTALQKLRWLVVNPWFQWRKWSSLYRALHFSLDDASKFERKSLEHTRQRKLLKANDISEQDPPGDATAAADGAAAGSGSN